MKRNHKIEVSFTEIFRKGTLTLATTFGAGYLFGKENMMIAFVLVLGSASLATQNLRIRTLSKGLRLIFIDLLLVGIAYIASLNRGWAVVINVITLFGIIYLNVSLYRQAAYKTLMMLYVFCQYSSVTLSELPIRMAMVIVTVSVVIASIYIEQNKKKALLPPQIEKAFTHIYSELQLLRKGKFSKEIIDKITYEMNVLAELILSSSFRKYFTTYIGKVHFEFYLNMSYLSLLLEQMSSERIRAWFHEEEINALLELFNKVNEYFKRNIKRKEVIEQFEVYLNKQPREEGFKEELREVISSLKKSFEELETLSIKDKNKTYDSWTRSELRMIRYKAKQYFNPKSMSFNFAARMSIILTISLLLANYLGFYKFIWAIIPIMSITQPYVEDTKTRKRDRFESNILAAVVLTVMINVIHIPWITFLILVAAFYLYYAYKDYYHASLFLTIISMCISTIGAGINTLFFYRMVYVIIGITVVELSSRLVPYRLADGMSEIVEEMERLNKILEEESLRSLENKEDLNRIRETTIYSAILSQKLYIKNEQYKSERIDYLIRTNREFVIRLGYSLLR